MGELRIRVIINFEENLQFSVQIFTDSDILEQDPRLASKIGKPDSSTTNFTPPTSTVGYGTRDSMYC